MIAQINKLRDTAIARYVKLGTTKIEITFTAALTRSPGPWREKARKRTRRATDPFWPAAHQSSCARAHGGRQQPPWNEDWPWIGGARQQPPWNDTGRTSAFRALEPSLREKPQWHSTSPDGGEQDISNTSNLGAILVHLGAVLGHLGPILGHLGAILERSWAHLGPILGLSWGILAPPCAIRASIHQNVQIWFEAFYGLVVVTIVLFSQNYVDWSFSEPWRRSKLSKTVQSNLWFFGAGKSLMKKELMKIIMQNRASENSKSMFAISREREKVSNIEKGGIEVAFRLVLGWF